MIKGLEKIFFTVSPLSCTFTHFKWFYFSFIHLHTEVYLPKKTLMSRLLKQNKATISRAVSIREQKKAFQLTNKYKI